VTNDLERRVYEHKQELVPGSTSKYNITMLAWYDTFANVEEAIEWEKRIKDGAIEEDCPDRVAESSWEDLSEGWYGGRDSSLCSE